MACRTRRSHTIIAPRSASRWLKPVVLPSLGSVGDAHDSARCKRSFATLEYELLPSHRLRAQVEARAAAFNFIAASPSYPRGTAP